VSQLLKWILFLNVMPDSIRHPGKYQLENILDSAKASLRARVKPGMTKNFGTLVFVIYNTASWQRAVGRDFRT